MMKSFLMPTMITTTAPFLLWANPAQTRSSLTNFLFYNISSGADSLDTFINSFYIVKNVNGTIGTPSSDNKGGVPLLLYGSTYIAVYQLFVLENLNDSVWIQVAAANLILIKVDGIIETIF